MSEFGQIVALNAARVVEGAGGVLPVVTEAAPTAVAEVNVAAAGVAETVCHRMAETGMPHLSRAAWQRTRWHVTPDAAR